MRTTNLLLICISMLMHVVLGRGAPWVLHDVHLHEVAPLLEKTTAVLAEVAQVQLLLRHAVPLRQVINGLHPACVQHSALHEVQHHVLQRLLARVQQIPEMAKEGYISPAQVLVQAT